MNETQTSRPRTLAFSYYLRLFVRARWLMVVAATSGLLLFQFVLPLQFPFAYLYATVSAVFLYNIFFWQVIRRTDFHEGANLHRRTDSTWLRRSRRWALLQIIADLVALFFLLHFTGGIENPFLIFFMLHAAVAAILLDPRRAILVAVFTTLLVFLLAITEKVGVFSHYHHVEVFGAFEPLDSWLFALGLPMIFALMVVCLTTLLIFITGEIHRRRDMIISLTEELEEKNSRLTTLDKMRQQTMAVVSHDLKSPINAVSAYLKNIKEGYLGTVSDKQLDVINKSLSRLDRLRAFVSDVLDWQTIERGELQQNMSPTALSGILNRTVDDYRDPAQARNITLTSDVPEALPLVNASASRMAQVFDNLISNAVKYTLDGGSVRIAAAVDSARDEILFTFSDTGIGMSEGDMAHLFQDFYRAPSVKSRFEGTGLGLSVVQRIVQAHHGRIWAQSEEGVGTVFSVALPIGRLSQPPRG